MRDSLACSLDAVLFHFLQESAWTAFFQKNIGIQSVLKNTLELSLYRRIIQG